MTELLIILVYLIGCLITMGWVAWARRYQFSVADPLTVWFTIGGIGSIWPLVLVWLAWQRGIARGDSPSQNGEPVSPPSEYSKQSFSGQTNLEQQNIPLVKRQRYGRTEAINASHAPADDPQLQADIVECDRAIDLNPRDAEKYVDRGGCYVDLAQFQYAKENREEFLLRLQRSRPARPKMR